MTSNSGSPIILVWDNFGYLHDDRCEDLAEVFSGRREVIGIEIAGSSDTYNWETKHERKFRKETLYSNSTVKDITWLSRFSSTLRACLRVKGADVFVCHYEHPATFIMAIVLRLMGRRVYVMNNSKFDDKDRKLFRELLKALFFWPYNGALVAGLRSAEYLKFLGVSSGNIASGYNTLSLSRILNWAEAPPAPDGLPLESRHFTIVARLVPKKNLFMALEAYNLYRNRVPNPQELHLCGYGPLEAQIRLTVERYGLEKHVIFHGGLQNNEVCKLLARTSALLLPSTEEQFGNVVIEAQTMGVPVIVSDNCGCWDHLVRCGVNGFVVEADNAIGLAYFMGILCGDPSLWRKMSLESRKFSELSDVTVFSRGISRLLEGKSEQLPSF